MMFWIISESCDQEIVNYVWSYTSTRRKFLRFSLINDLGETGIEIEHEKSKFLTIPLGSIESSIGVLPSCEPWTILSYDQYALTP